MVMLDDTGFSDLGCYGSEIRTPTIDRLAAAGLRYSNFHVTPLCSPTRASLLTGRNHHSVGMRFLADLDTGYQNSRGRVDPDVTTLPAALRERSYGTYLVGKWHLTPAHEITPSGPYQNWPLAKGFDRFYGFLDGCTDQHTPELYEDHHQVSPGADGYHLSTDLCDRAIGYVTEHVTFRPHDPFYLQLAFGATHAPFQAPEEYIAPYRDIFAKGWDRTRTDRLHRQVELGIVPEETALADRNPSVPAWSDLSDDEQELYVHLQAAYAGFLEHADAQLGRVIEALERTGELDNTIVMVMSDNGASREGARNGGVDTNVVYSHVPYSLEQQRRRLGEIGGPGAGAHYPEGWAMAGNTPFRYWKQFVDLGGVRSPLIVHWPEGVADVDAVRSQFAHVIDLAPTVLDCAGAEPSPQMHGESIAESFRRSAAPPTRSTQYWEMFGHRAILHGRWRAVTAHEEGAGYDLSEWRLYDTETDFAETTDVAADHPDVVQLLDELWWREAELHGVFPVDDRPLKLLLNEGVGVRLGLAGQDQVVLRPGAGHVPVSTKLAGIGRSQRVRAHLHAWDSSHEGVMLASGTGYGGYVLYIQGGQLVFEHVAIGERVRVQGRLTTAGDVTVGFEVRTADDHSAQVRLLQGEEEIGKVDVPFTFGHLSFWGVDVGRDRLCQVSDAYPGEFAFPDEVLDRVEITVLSALNEDDLVDLAMRES
ncbi:arylsulfatase [Ruania alba]|uniref:arylsulfatase n=1 Tax=Ruania alba TaxID=648782 RepID=UPI002481CBE0|nr:arylsulfatase [Ruania alba]